ncbi:MAG: class I SAM-dependent methyltransferase [Pseudomonadota bacterium]
MTTTEDQRKQQFDYWNGEMGKAWAEAQDFFDGMLQPFEELLVEEVEHLSPRSVLDVGCGNGTTTLAIKRNLPSRARCVGIDISEPMLANARDRAATTGLGTEFLLADAAVHRFKKKEYDVIASRFGVMFFADPDAAFANLRRATKTKGHLRFIVWRSPEDNEFMTAAARAAAPLLPNFEPRDPSAPGPFSMANADDTRSCLMGAGWGRPELIAHDVTCRFPRSKLELFFASVERLGINPDDLDPSLLNELSDAIRDAYAPYIKGDQVEFVGRCWMIRAPSQ